jgi:hypothetical protein
VFTFDRIFRYGPPAVMLLVCAVVLIVSPDIIGFEIFGIVFGGAAAIVLVNYIQKKGFAGDVDRSKEAQARDFFNEYGMWPDQAPRELVEEAKASGLLSSGTFRTRSSKGTSRYD